MSKKGSDSSFPPKGKRGGRTLDQIPPNQGKKSISKGDLANPLSHRILTLRSHQAWTQLLPSASPPNPSALSRGRQPILGTVDLEPGTNPRVFMERPQVQACRAGLNHRSRSRLEALVLWLCQSPFQIVSLWMLHVFCHQSHSYKTGILHTRFSWGNCSEFICIPQLSWQRDLLPLFSQAEADSWLGGRGWSSPFLLLHSWLLQKCISALPCSVMFLKISQECKQKSLFFDVGCLNVRSGKGLHSQATTELWPVV